MKRVVQKQLNTTAPDRVQQVGKWLPPRAAAKLLLLIASLVLLATTTAGAQGANDSQPSNLAPTLPGAPFLAEEARSKHVLQRLDSLTALEELERAQQTLALRTADARTAVDLSLIHI